MADHLAALKPLVPADFSLGYSTDWRGAEAMLAGGAAWYSVLGGLFPEVCMAIRRAVAVGDAADARQLNDRARTTLGAVQGAQQLSRHPLRRQPDRHHRCRPAPPHPAARTGGTGGGGRRTQPPRSGVAARRRLTVGVG